MGQSSSKASSCKESDVLCHLSAQRSCLVKIRAESFGDFLTNLCAELTGRWADRLGPLPSLEALEVFHEGRWQPFREWRQITEQTELRIAEPHELHVEAELARGMVSSQDCHVGERVQVLPPHLAEGPTRNSAANWTRACREHAGQQANVVQVDKDNTIRLRFDDGEELWYAVGSCTKTLRDDPQPPNVEAWVTGAGGRGAKLNGVYRPHEPVYGCHSFRNSKTGAKIYKNHYWKISPNSLTGWFYSVLGEFELPPEGPWSTHGYGSRDVLPAPEVWLFEPYDIYVETGAAAGCYRRESVQNQRPVYVMEGGGFAISWVDGTWKLSDGQSEWSYRSEERYPPEGQFKGELGTVTIRRELLTLEAFQEEEAGVPIERAADCSVGDGVRVLPLHLAEQPTRDSSATWTDACAARCGQSGVIVIIDRDETIRVRFKDGGHLWLSVRSCTKTGTVEQENVCWRVSGAEGSRGASLNGIYQPDGEENGKPLYRQVHGNGVLYAGSDDTWRLSPGSLGGWFFRVDSAAVEPPRSGWTTSGFNGKGVSGTPTLGLEDMSDRPPPLTNRTPSETSSEASCDLVPQQTVPDIVCVKGAGGVGISCNGEFCVNGTFKGRPKYKKKGGEAIIYFKECWKLNYQDDTEGWYYSVSGNEPFPPERIWTTEGYDDDDANPAPSVSHGPAEACPIAVIGECQQGQRVRILPAAQAAPAQQGSCAPWSEDCLAHCGDVGEITMVADNGTIRVTFEEGDSYWFAIGACVKVT